MRTAVLLVLISIVSACGPTLAPGAAIASRGTTANSIVSGPRISPPPVTPPTPPKTDLPAFACADWSGGKIGVANTVTARTAEQPDYDRFVLQFDSIVPTYSVKRQAKPVFSMGASGETALLSGTAGVLVTVHSATGTTTFTGSTDLVTANFVILREARQTQDFEGYVSWGLGLANPACMRVFTLTDPARLVVDFQTGGSQAGA